MIEIEHREDDDSIIVRASGKLTARYHELAVPEIEHSMELSKGPLRMLIRLEDFKG
jgi:hypothetical protein